GARSITSRAEPATTREPQVSSRREHPLRWLRRLWSGPGAPHMRSAQAHRPPSASDSKLQLTTDAQAWALPNTHQRRGADAEGRHLGHARLWGLALRLPLRDARRFGGAGLLRFPRR